MKINTDQDRFPLSSKVVKNHRSICILAAVKARDLWCRNSAILGR